MVATTGALTRNIVVLRIDPAGNQIATLHPLLKSKSSSLSQICMTQEDL